MALIANHEEAFPPPASVSASTLTGFAASLALDGPRYVSGTHFCDSLPELADCGINNVAIIDFGRDAVVAIYIHRGVHGQRYELAAEDEGPCATLVSQLVALIGPKGVA